MTPTQTAAARVSGTITSIVADAAQVARSAAGTDPLAIDAIDYMESLILAAIQADPEPVTSETPMLSPKEPQPVAWRYRPVDTKSPWSNVTEHRRTAYGRIGMEEQPLYATPSSAGTVSVEDAARVAECAFDDRPRCRVGHPSHMDWEDGFRDGTNAAAAALRALAGGGGR